MQQHSHDLECIDHAVANFSSGQVPTQVETKHSDAIQRKEREDRLSIYVKPFVEEQYAIFRHKYFESDINRQKKVKLTYTMTSLP